MYQDTLLNKSDFQIKRQMQSPYSENYIVDFDDVQHKKVKPANNSQKQDRVEECFVTDTQQS